MALPVPTEPTELVICTTCRRGGATPQGLPAGQALFDQLQAACPADAPVRLKAQACLAACSRSCAMALQARGKATYVFAGLAPDADAVEAALAVAQQHAASPDGLLAWTDRPARLRQGLVARLPPLTATAAADGGDP